MRRLRARERKRAPNVPGSVRSRNVTSSLRLGSLSRLVFGEMLSQFPRLENYVDSRKVRALELLRSIGFTVEAAVPRPAAEADYHRVWIDSDRLMMGGRACNLPN